jgi:hypothetical protein
MKNYLFIFLISILSLIVLSCSETEEEFITLADESNTSSGLYVAVGYGGTILTSADGINWSSRTSGTGSSIYGVAQGNKNIIAVVENGLILSSSDGSSWENKTTNTSDFHYGITFKGITYITVGKSGKIYSSTDGSSWTLRSSDTSNDIRAVTYGTNKFVAVGNSGTILTSLNGVSSLNTSSSVSGSWGPSGGASSTSSANPSYTLNVTDNGTVTIELTSSVDTYLYLLSGSTVLEYDDDAGTAFNSRISSNLNAGTYTVVAATAYDSLSGSFSLSVSGAGSSLTNSVWTTATSGTTNNLLGITFGNSTFVAVGDSGSILSSTDGTSWSARTSGTSSILSGVSYGNNIFVAVGSSGTILTSADGTNWNNIVTKTSNGLQDVTYGNGTFVAVGDSGTILTSTDGVNRSSWGTLFHQNALMSVTYIEF